MKQNPNEFALFLGQCADRHDGYLMGAVGQNPKELHEWYFNQYREEEKQYAQALLWRGKAQRVWDCQGLADGYLTERLGEQINVRARNNYASWCGVRGEGEIPYSRRVPGAAVFMDNGEYIHHVGFLEKPVTPGEYAGDWWVVEARGVMHGVVRTRLYERRWNRWGWMTKYFDYRENAEPPRLEYGQRNLMLGCRGEDVAQLQRDLISLNYSCGKWGADGEFGHATMCALTAFQLDYELQPDGIAGPKTYAVLDGVFEESGEEAEKGAASKPVETVFIGNGRTWNIRTQPDGSAPVMGYAARGSTYEFSGQRVPGWVGIIHFGEPAWISEKAVAE